MILVDVYVPSVGKTYDFHLEENAAISVIIEEISEMVGHKERTRIIGDTSGLQICDKAGGKTMPKASTLAKCGICNGDSLILV